MATLGLIFSAIHDNENFEITKNRTIASLPVGGRYRLIDFSLSNLVNNNVSHIGVVTKNNYQSLMDHVGSGKEWDLARKNGGLIILPPYGVSEGLFQTRLEALKSIIQFIRRAPEEYVILTDCYHVCNIDYRPIFAQHKATQADITCVYNEQNITKDSYRPVKTFTIDKNQRIIDMKVANEISGKANSSLDIWIMKKDLLERLVTNSIAKNLKSFNRDILSQNLEQLRIFGYCFKGFFRDINSIKTYYDLNMDLLKRDVRSELFMQDNQAIYTKVRDSAPTRYGENAKVINSMIADGCVIEGEVINSVIFRGTTISKGAKVNDSILMQDTFVSKNTTLSHIITDKNVAIVHKKELVGTKEIPIYIDKNEVI